MLIDELVICLDGMFLFEKRMKKEKTDSNDHSTDDEDFLQKELTHALPRAAFMELRPEHMTGKLVNES